MTDIESIKDMTMALFDSVPIEPVEGMGFLSIHPFASSPYVANPEGGMVDLTTPEGWLWYRRKIEKKVRERNLPFITSLIRPPFLMTWFRYASEFMSEKDFAHYLVVCWVTEENPNQDKNVSRKRAVGFFKAANKKYLMAEDELAYYNALPDTLTIYRGVSPGRERNGLSWTDDLDVAAWFKKRFEKKDLEGYILKATISKKYVLAYFNRHLREEHELVVDVYGIQKKIEVLKGSK